MDPKGFKNESIGGSAFFQDQVWNMDIKRAQEKSMDLKSTYYSQDGRWCYQISIIDYLQTFDKGKKSEVVAKKVLKRADTSKLSA